DGFFGGAADPDNFEVFIMDINGGNVRRLTFSPGFDGEATFSPDGKRIAYVSNCGGNAGDGCPGNLDIYVMDLNGVILQRVTSSPLSDVEPAWSPDGTRIVYTRVTDQGSPIITDEQKELRINDADGLDKNERLLFDEPGQDHDASFHPSGTELL